MKTNLLKSIRLTLLLLLATGLYILAVWGLAQLIPGGGSGHFVTAQGRKYYAQIGQRFYGDQYFQGRPSAVNYNAAGGAGSNQSPSNTAYLQRVAARIDTFLLHNPGIARREVPVALVTASGSGLDPHISPGAALVQVARIAKARHLPESALRQLVARHTAHPFPGPPVVHVLRLNLALDQVAGFH